MDEYHGYTELDVVMPEGEYSDSGVIRCGYGVWVPTHILRIEALVGLISWNYVQKAQTILSCMVKGEKLPLINEPSCHETDTADPDYEEVMGAVSIAANKLSELVQKG